MIATWRHAPRRDEQDGIAIYWLAMFIVVILSASALTVDLGFRHLMAERAQNAADAAALAGTIFLPSDFSQADSRARQVAMQNGFDPNDPNVSIATAPVSGQPTQLSVTITKKIPVFFAGIMGFKTMTVRKTATADYDQPVEMGSPSNTFGNQPDCNLAPNGVCSSIAGTQTPQMWANIEGPGTGKSKGNAFTSNTCDAASDGCPGGVNADYQSTGELFTIRNANAGTTLRVDLFDAVYAHVGDTCGDPALAALYAAQVASHAPNAARYQPGPWAPVATPSASPYCTGDVSTASVPALSTPTQTRFQLYAPDATPWTIIDNVPVPGCGLTIDGTNDVSGSFASIQTWFRQWSTLCTIPGAVAGDYVLQVTTPLGTGNNNFSIRVADSGSLVSPNVSVFGHGNMAIYANGGINTKVSFYLARVLPGSSGRTLSLDFFDAGDTLGGSTGTLQVVPPADATGSAARVGFSGCTFAKGSGNAAVATGPGCLVSGVDGSFNGKWVHWQVPIPSDYSCSYATLIGCWVQINFSFPGGGVLDVTSWKATLGGNPVRIIN